MTRPFSNHHLAAAGLAIALSQVLALGATRSPRPLDQPHANQPMPKMAPKASEVAMHIYNAMIKVDKEVPSGVLQDILFFDGDRQVLFTLRSPHGVCGGDYALYDGDPETTLTVDEQKGQSIGTTVLRLQRVSHMIIRTRDHQALKGVRVSLQSTHWQDIFNDDLALLADQPAAPAYRIDLRTHAVTPLKDVPAVNVYCHPDLGSLIREKALAPISLKQQADGALVLPGEGLAPGQSVAVTWKQSGQHTFRADTYKITLGTHAFDLKNHTVLTVPDGSALHARRAMGPAPVATTMMLTRGTGNKAGTITWHILGIRHDTMGTATLASVDQDTVLPVTIHCIPGQGKDRPKTVLAGVASGEARSTLPEVTRAPEHRDWPELAASIYHWYPPRLRDDVKKQYGVTLPSLNIADYEKGPTREELEDFINYAVHFPTPTSNKNNKIIFGIEQASRGLYFGLCLTDRPELLTTLETWAASILSHRNDKRYQVPVVADNSVTPDVQPDTMAPAWPQFNKVKGYMDGGPVTGTLTIGPPLIPMLCYAEYIAEHPDLWEKPCATTQMTHWERALEFVREAEISVDYTVYHFVEPRTKRITQPWNRYSTFVTACMHLARLYERLESQDDHFQNPERRQLYRDIVSAYIRYMADDEAGGHHRAYVRYKGNLVPVMTVPYAPLGIRWGGRAETIGYSCLDYGVHLSAFHDGSYGTALTDAHAFELGYSWLLRVFSGYALDGRPSVSKNVNGSGGWDRGSLSIVHKWTSAYVPKLYTTLDKVITDPERLLGAQEDSSQDQGLGLHGFAEVMWLEHVLDEKGLHPHSRRSPELSIMASQTHVRPGEPVTFKVKRSGDAGRAVTYAWDVNEDGQPDGTEATLTHAFHRPGIFPVTVRVTDGEGLWAPALICVVVDEMPPGRGQGYATVSIWSDTLEGDNIKGMEDAPGYPDTPERQLKVTALDLDGIEGLQGTNKAGFLFEGFITPSKTGEYLFAVSSSRNSELFLSHDESEGNLKKLGWTYGFRPRGNFTYHWGQKTKEPVHLEAGKRYRFRARAWVDFRGTGPHFAAAWKLADSGELVPIEGEYLSPVRQ